MIRIDEISAEEAQSLTGQSCALLRRSRQIWKISLDELPLFVAGVISQSFLGRAEVWLLPLPGLHTCPRTTLRKLLKMMKMLKEVYPCLLAQVKSTSPTDRAFARFCGFTEVGVNGDWIVCEA